LIFGGEDGEEGDDVRMGELLEDFKFADSVGGETFCVFFLDFNFFDGDEFGGVGLEVTKVDIGVGSLTEFLAWKKLERGRKGV
jgi:hypothetical protein